MKYMVIERFKSGGPEAVYERFARRGRMLPKGLVYLDSWVTRDRSVCYQLMETDDAALFGLWIAAWSDLVDFTVEPVMSSKEAAGPPK